MIISFNQRGRSMIEMLGVLSIIGVLSVGAISGYQKAMYKYKLNLLTSGINQLLVNLSEIFGNDKSKLNTFTDSVYVIKSLNILPQGFSYNNSYSLIAPFNINLGIRLDLGTKELNRNYVAFLITVGSQKLCQDFLAQNWYNDNSYYIAVKPFDDSEIEADDNIVYYRWKNINHLNNLPEINAICAKYCASSQCSIALEQYLNVPN